MRFLLFSLLTVLTLFGRENPFRAAATLEGASAPTPTYLSKESICLPSNARVIKNITFELVNDDGSIQLLSLPVNKEIDWRRTIVLSHDGTAPKERAAISKGPYSINGSMLTLATAHKPLRDFTLSSPARIVLDFALGEGIGEVKTTSARRPFMRISSTKNSAYERVVITLDAPSPYTLELRKQLILKLK